MNRVIQVKVITIKQPYASLIAAGIKEYEFRTWKTKYRGKIAIHAGLGVDKKAMEKYKAYQLEYPSGAILAIADLVDCIIVDGRARKMLNEKNPFVYSHVINDTSWKGYGFQLSNVKKIKPIFIKGKLGFWNYELEQEEV